MKVKTILISTVVCTALAGGSIYGAYYYARSQKKPVEVVPIGNVNYASQGWGYSDSDSSMTGEIVSRDSQSITLNSEYTLKEVYVQEGDTVKKGDKLLEYDMTLDELKREMEDLTYQTLEITLDSEEQQLEKMKNGTYSDSSSSAGIDASLDSDMTGSADTELINDESMILDDESNQVDDNSGETAPIEVVDDNSGETTPTDEADVISPESESQSSDETDTQQPEGDNDGLISADDSADDEDDLLIDVPDEETEASTEKTVVTPSAAATLFLSFVEQKINPEKGEVTLSNVKLALEYWKDIANLTETTLEGLDPFLESGRKIPHYELKTDAIQGLDPETLYKAYALVCAQNVKCHLKEIIPSGTSVEAMTDSQIEANESMIRGLVDAYYQYQAMRGDLTSKGISDIFTSEQYQIDDSNIGKLAARVNMLHIITPEPETEEPTTEFDDDFGGDFGDDLGGGGLDGSGYSAEELKAMIKQQESDIEETKLQMRESELRLKQYDRKLNGKIVKASMDGVVRAAGTVDTGTTDGDAFIVIAGKSGMYVKGLISELSLDSVSIGDTVSGTSYDTGLNFSAEVTEIEVYPQDNSDYFSYSYGSENKNASYYPFYAYIEDADGLTEGQVEMKLTANQSNAAISLEQYFVRTDDSNHEYVYIQGTDGKLKKQYVKTHTSSDGYSIAIDAGLSTSDKIAFPYGKNVVEGAQTIEVDTLSAGEYY